jgi:hypothetical protein
MGLESASPDAAGVSKGSIKRTENQFYTSSYPLLVAKIQPENQNSWRNWGLLVSPKELKRAPKSRHCTLEFTFCPGR